MSSIRLRRLQSDYQRLRDYLLRQPRVRMIQAEGNPPERYQLEYQIRGLRQVDDQLHLVNSHMVEIFLPRDYPRLPPQCRMLTPVFHPNIAPHAICIGDHWSAGEPLWSMVARIGEMIAYQSYNTKSPLNGEAAQWVEENQQRVPLDRVAMFVEEPGRPQAARPAPQAAPAGTPGAIPMVAPLPPRARTAAPTPAAQPQTPPAATGAAVDVACPSCQARYRVPLAATARRFRCKRCQAILQVPGEGGAP